MQEQRGYGPALMPRKVNQKLHSSDSKFGSNLTSEIKEFKGTVPLTLKYPFQSYETPRNLRMPKYLLKRHIMVVTGKYLYFIIPLKNPGSTRHRCLFGNKMKDTLGRNMVEIFPECIFVINGTTELSLFLVLQRSECIHVFTHLCQIK